MALLNSLIMALGVCVGKIAISIIAAYAVVYFRFPLRMFFFWMIFMTLMLPVEVRIVPTYQVVASLGMLDSYSGLIVPLIASATATFLFRQFFLSVPDELTEAARIDGAGPVRFFIDILLPMSRTTIAALFVIQFIYGWNQYLWPLLITTKESFYTVVMTLSRQVNTVDAAPSWNWIMAMAMLAMLPPVLVVVFMQRQFVKGLGGDGEVMLRRTCHFGGSPGPVAGPGKLDCARISVKARRRSWRTRQANLQFSPRARREW